MFERLRLRLRALVRPRAMEEELDEELRYHLENETARNLARGMHPADAALAARRAFGNATQLKEQVRDGWGRRWAERIGQDARYAWRSFRRAPAFAAGVVATIALALGLNTAAFTFFDAYVLRPMAVRDPGSLFELSWFRRDGERRVFTRIEYEALHGDHAAFAESFAYRFLFARVDSAPTYGHLVAGNYFSMLGVGAALGRTLLPSDAAVPGGAPVIVISDALWRSRFGGDSSIIGRSIRVRGRALEVVGVAARGFGGLGDVPIDFWAPLTLTDAFYPGDSVYASGTAPVLSIVARIRPEIAPDQASAWLVSWMRARRAGDRERERPATAQLLPRATAIPPTPELVLFFTPIAAAFVIVLLIACANVANMMLARGLARQRELGIRLSLGAGRARLVGQLLTESVLLALPAAVLGFGLSRVTIEGALRLVFLTLPPELTYYFRLAPMPPDGRIFLFILAAAVGSAVLFGLAPAIQATRPNIVHATRGELDVAYRPARLRNALVIGQITVCVLLLVCAGVILRGVGRLQRLDIGLRTGGVVRVDLQERAGTRDAALAVLRTRPAIHALAAATDPPFNRRFPTVTVLTDSGRAHATFYDFVTASYFPLLEVPIVHGRNFTADEERAGAPVAIISEGTARAFWPHRDPLGLTIRLALDTTAAAQRAFLSRRVARVVGVVPDVALGTIIDRFDSPVVYYPIALRAPGTAILARVSGSITASMRRIDEDLTRVAPESVEDIHTLDAYVVGGIYPFRVAYWIAASLGAIALLLTLSGVYGVLSYVVAQRRKELCIRVALGASPAIVTGLVLGESARDALLGLVLGSLLAVGVARLFAANILGVKTFEPYAFAGATLLVLATALLAAYVPSRRAAKVDPMHALRGD